MAGRWIVLLRGINVGGHHRLPMADLRAMAEGLGWREVRTYIQSGNLVCSADGRREELEEALEAALRVRFPRGISVLIRSAEAFRAILAANPFPDEAESDAKRLLLGLGRKAPSAAAVEALAAKATKGERCARAGGCLWIYFPEGAGRSKLGVGKSLDRALGGPVTTRNWRTATKLATLL